MIDLSWDSLYASGIAAQCDIALTERHWEVIHQLRVLYQLQGKHPSVRVLMASLREKSQAGTMLELMKLFGEQPLRVMSRIAGLPEPPHCI